MANTPTRPIRVDLDLWDAFGEACSAVGTDRTKALVGYMRRVVDAMAPSELPECADRSADPDLVREQ